MTRPDLDALQALLDKATPGHHPLSTAESAAHHMANAKDDTRMEIRVRAGERGERIGTAILSALQSMLRRRKRQVQKTGCRPSARSMGNAKPACHDVCCRKETTDFA